MTHAFIASIGPACRDVRVPAKKEDVDRVPGLGDRLRVARARKKLTQEAAAHEIGVASGTYSKYEGDKLGMTVGVLARITEVYDASADELLGRKPARAEHVEYDDDAPNEHFETFKKITNLEALGVTPAELEHVRRAPFRGGARSPLDYQRALLALLKVDDLPQPAGLKEAQERAKAHKDSKRQK